MEIIAPKGERTLVRYGVALQRSFAFTAQGMDGGDPMGEVEILRSRFLKRKPPEHTPLLRDQTVALEFGVTDFAVYVTPEADVTITYETGSVLPGVAGFIATAGFIAFIMWEALNWLWTGR